ncbi:hypothetical protein Q9189_000039 [Teloschistes chrysophthalmus]
MSDHPTLLRPTPRRHFTPASTRPSTPPADQDSDRPSLSDRKRSILNLTSSTLFGIYAPSDSPRDGMSTPASGIETPGLRYSIDDNRPPILGAFDKPEFHRRPSQPHITLRNYYLPLSLRTILLFFFGVAYGSVVTHLHDNPQIAPVKVEGIERYTWRYLAFWGLAGIVLGRLLPWVDILWERTMGERRHAVGYFAISSGNASSDEGEGEGERSTSRIESVLGADWNPAVRSIGAFVGIAFAIVRAVFASSAPTKICPM